MGSAVGIGNVWLFPWRIGEFGGIVFILQYFILLVLVGIVGLIGEFSLGRLTKGGPTKAFEAAFSSKGFSFGGKLSLIPIFGAFGIAAGYAVVVGWLLRYAVGSVDSSLFNAPNLPSYFGSLIGDYGSWGWHLAALLFTLFILQAGVQKGIERANKIIMPAFYILFVLLFIGVLTLPNIEEGLKYLLTPKWEAFFSAKAWAVALGQAFFSLSLAGSGMVVYGSYLSEKEDIPRAAIYTALYSFIGALLCALVIMPAVIACKIDPNAGPPLVFITLPLVFKQMPMGQAFAAIFFICVLFAAITSLMNLLECPIQALEERFKLSRFAAVALTGLACFGVGLFLENASHISSWMDVLSVFVVPLGAFLGGVAIYWMFGMKAFFAQCSLGASKPLPGYFTFLAKYLFCAVALVVVVLSACHLL